MSHWEFSSSSLSSLLLLSSSTTPWLYSSSYIPLISLIPSLVPSLSLSISPSSLSSLSLSPPSGFCFSNGHHNSQGLQYVSPLPPSPTPPLSIVSPPCPTACINLSPQIRCFSQQLLLQSTESHQFSRKELRLQLRTTSIMDSEKTPVQRTLCILHSHWMEEDLGLLLHCTVCLVCVCLHSNASNANIPVLFPSSLFLTTSVVVGGQGLVLPTGGGAGEDQAPESVLPSPTTPTTHHRSVDHLAILHLRVL